MWFSKSKQLYRPFRHGYNATSCVCFVRFFRSRSHFQLVRVRLEDFPQTNDSIKQSKDQRVPQRNRLGNIYSVLSNFHGGSSLS